MCEGCRSVCRVVGVCVGGWGSVWGVWECVCRGVVCMGVYVEGLCLWGCVSVCGSLGVCIEGV